LKRKITVENCDLVHQFEELLFSLARIETVCNPMEDAKKLAYAETRERINLLGKMRHLQNEMGVMKGHLEEEFEAKQEMKRQLSKAFANIQLWKTRYEIEGVACGDEI
jgi:myosin heavy chain 6/7